MGQFIGPDAVDQLICRNESVGVDQQRRQNTALPGRADIEPLPVGQRLDISENPEFHRHAFSLHQVRAGVREIAASSGLNCGFHQSVSVSEATHRMVGTSQ